MVSVVESFTKFKSVGGRWLGLPAWARFLLLIAALPGIVLIALSFLAFLVSLLALLLLTVPLYRLLKLITGTGEGRAEAEASAADLGSPGRKRVEATVVDVPPAEQGL
jgi:hypothetical protein